MFEHPAHVAQGVDLNWFGSVVRVEVVGRESLGGLRVAVKIGEEREERGGVLPCVLAAGFGHPDQLAQGQSVGGEPESSGELVAESESAVSASSIFLSSSGSSSFASA